MSAPAPHIWDSPQWAALKAHADTVIAGMHLRELMKVRRAAGRRCPRVRLDRSFRDTGSPRDAARLEWCLYTTVVF